MSGQLTGYGCTVRKTKRTAPFKPTDMQIRTACSRIIGVLHKYHGMIDVASADDAIRMLCRTVFNRGRELGDIKQGHFQVTIRAAYNLLIEEGHLAWHENGLGTTVVPQRRHHRQKYPQRGRQARQAA